MPMKKKHIFVIVLLTLFALLFSADETEREKGGKKTAENAAAVSGALAADDTKEATLKGENQESVASETPDNKTPEGEEAGASSTPFFKAALQDQGNLYAAPFRIKNNEWLAWGGVAAATGLLIIGDEAIYREIKRFQARNDWVNDISPKITRLGSGEFNLGIAGLFGLGGWIFNDRRALETAKLTLMTFIHTGLTVQLGKHLTGRQRPSWENGADHWSGPAGFFRRYKKGEIAHYDAFPSGHTISIFGTATVIAEMYKKTVWVPALCYSAAALTGLSRVTEDTHWLSDVFLGAVLGYVIGKYVVKHRGKAGNFVITPKAGAGGAGISAIYLF